MKKGTRTAIITVAVIVIILLIVYLGISIIAYTSVGRLPVDANSYPTAQIQELIWPTIGYPALVTPGNLLEIEIDSGGEFCFEPDPLDISGWQALITPVREALSELSYSLKATRVWKAVSDHWPKGTSKGSPEEVWHMEFEIPDNAVPELYDISVENHTAYGVFSDEEPHAVAVKDEMDDTFTFLTLRQFFHAYCF